MIQTTIPTNLLSTFMSRRHISSQIPWLGMLFVGIMPSSLKRIYYRLQGAKIGKRVKIGMCSYVRGADICISDDAEIAPFTFINVKGKFHLGARSSIKSFTVIDTGEFVMGEDSVIREQVIIGGALTPRSSVIIGSRTKIYLNSIMLAISTGAAPSLISIVHSQISLMSARYCAVATAVSGAGN